MIYMYSCTYKTTKTTKRPVDGNLEHACMPRLCQSLCPGLNLRAFFCGWGGGGAYYIPDIPKSEYLKIMYCSSKTLIRV